MESRALIDPQPSPNTSTVQEMRNLKKDRDKPVMERSNNMPGEKLSVRKRPFKLIGTTYRMQTGCGSIYVTINENEQGLFELFTKMGKAGGCAASQSEAIGRMVSLAWRSSIDARQVIRQLRGISCHSPFGFGENKVLSCADAVARAIQFHLTAKGLSKKVEAASLIQGACPECGGQFRFDGGCPVCCSCGHSKCG